MSFEQVFEQPTAENTRIILLVVSRISEAGCAPYSRVVVGEVYGQGDTRVVGSTVDKSTGITGLSVLEYLDQAGVVREASCPICGATPKLLGEHTPEGWC